MAERIQRMGVSRRSFLAGACAGTAALVAGSLASPKEAFGEGAQADVEVSDYDGLTRGSYQVNMKNVDPFPAIEEPDSYDYETDILLIGYGVGGTSAALTAVNQGCEVVVMERCTKSTWHEHAGVQFVEAFGEPRWLEKIGLPAWNEETVTRFLGNMTSRKVTEGDMEAVVQFFLSIPTAFKQIEESGGDATSFEPVVTLPSRATYPGLVPTNANFGGDIRYPFHNKYFAVENYLDSIVTKNGGQVLWGVPATNLILDSSGAVVGAKGADAKGNEVFVKAKAVIDCIGGFAANYDMIKYFGGSLDQIVSCNLGGLVNDGAGIRLCQGAGAGLRGLPHADDFADGGLDVVAHGLQWNYLNHNEAYSDRTVTGFLTTEIVLGRQPFLKVNKYGKRFMDEDGSWREKVHNSYYQPDHRFFTIYDSTLEDQINDIYTVQNRWGACERPQTPDLYIYFSDDDIRPLGDWHDGVQDAIDKGFIIQADTLEELAEKCGINAENLKDTVEKYNAMCDAGEDTEFGKDPSVLYPVKEPPFYGLERMAGFTWSQGQAIATERTAMS